MTDTMTKINDMTAHMKHDANLCYAAYDIISDARAEEQAALLEQFIVCYNVGTSDETQPNHVFIRKDEEVKLLRTCSKIVDPFAEQLRERRLSQQEFYTTLWRFLSTEEKLPDKKARVMALMSCASDRRFPYYEVDYAQTVCLSDEEYTSYNAAVDPNVLGKIQYLINGAEFEQKTETAAELLKLLDAETDPNHRLMIMTRIVACYTGNLLGEKLRCDLLEMRLDFLENMIGLGGSDDD